MYPRLRLLPRQQRGGEEKHRHCILRCRGNPCRQTTRHQMTPHRKPKRFVTCHKARPRCLTRDVSSRLFCGTRRPHGRRSASCFLQQRLFPWQHYQKLHGNNHERARRRPVLSFGCPCRSLLPRRDLTEGCDENVTSRFHPVVYVQVND